MCNLVLTPEQLARDLSLRDLTDPDAGPHAVQVIVDSALAALRVLWPSTSTRVHRGDRVVTVADNYTDLGYPADAAARDARYSRYVDAALMLRAHTSALIPSALRDLARADAAGEAVDDVVLACPGIVYRRDSIDRLHTGTPHQLDLWRIRRASVPLGEDDLVEMIDAVVATAVPGSRWRSVPRVHPYTVSGRQVDVADAPAWIEVAECGLAHPDVLRRAGLDPEGWSGLAMGIGLDRLVMLRKRVPDIRLLRSDDPRVADQMLDLAPYRPVSAQPAVERDLSVAVWEDDDLESLGDRVRDALGDDADSVEEVSVLSETAYRDLPEDAIARLGMGPNHRNVLVRVVLRRLDRALTRAEANQLRDRIYAALHQGTVSRE